MAFTFYISALVAHVGVQAVAMATASLMAQAAGAFPITDICPAPSNSISSVAIRQSVAITQTVARMSGVDRQWILNLVLVVSIALNVILLCCCCGTCLWRCCKSRRRQRSVETQSQCTYRRGNNPRFHGAFNFEGYVATHIH